MTVTTVSSSGESRNRIDIVFIGDGYSVSEINTTFAADVNALTTYLFNDSALTQPFGRYQDFFNVHRVDLVSNQSGTDNPGTGTVKDTALQSSFYWDGVTERLLYVNSSATSAALSTSLSGTDIDAEMVFVPVNTSKYGGGGGNYAVYAGSNSSALEIAVHEVAHSFADLADEYGTNTGRYSGGEPSAANVSLDSNGAKWHHWLGYTDANTGTVGAYEGGYYYENDIYRPSYSSKMRVLNKAFDPVAREQFILKFYELVDPLDSHTLIGESLSGTDLNSLAVTPIDDDLITVEWSIDGTIVQSSGPTLNLQHQSLSIGRHTITARAFDDTDWVRVSDRSSLEDSVTWSINWTGAVPSGIAVTDAADNYLADSLDGIVFGLAGNDTIHGSAGNDLIYGNTDADYLIGGLGSDTLFGGQQSDILIGGDQGDVVYGNKADDSLSGGVGNDTLYGGQENDVVLGADGDDRLDGNRADDTLSGGAGADVFVFSQGHDIALDFVAGEDSIQAMDDFAQVTQVVSAGHLVMTDSSGNTLTLMGQTDFLSVGDFTIF